MSSISSVPFEILGIGAPLIDHVIPVDDAYLESIEAIKGSMRAVDYRTFRRIILLAKSEINLRVGGSSANTIKGLAQFGHRCALVGKIGQDSASETFIKSLQKSNVKSLLIRSTTPTGQLACLVSPDGERTFRDFLGASTELNGSDLTPDMFRGVKLVHIEAYTLINEAVTQRAMALAKQAGAMVSFDLSNFEVVKQYREQIVHLLSQHVDILFANTDETRMLTGCEPEKGCAILKDLCTISIVLMGAEGCWVGSGLDMIRCYAYPEKPVDTTGAGDLFAAGFLHGYLTGQDLATCAHYGALTAAAVVKVFGAEMPDEAWNRIRAALR